MRVRVIFGTVAIAVTAILGSAGFAAADDGPDDPSAQLQGVVEGVYRPYVDSGGHELHQLVPLPDEVPNGS